MSAILAVSMEIDDAKEIGGVVAAFARGGKWGARREE
jgi:hypothetical protein